MTSSVECGRPPSLPSTVVKYPYHLRRATVSGLVIWPHKLRLLTGNKYFLSRLPADSAFLAGLGLVLGLYATRMGFTYYRHDLDLLNETSQYKLFCRSWSELHCLHHLFTVKSRSPGAMHLRQRGYDFFYQISYMNLINATLLLAHFLITSNISCVLCVPMSMYFMILFYFFRGVLSSLYVNMCACHMYF